MGQIPAGTILIVSGQHTTYNTAVLDTACTCRDETSVISAINMTRSDKYQQVQY